MRQPGQALPLETEKGKSMSRLSPSRIRKPIATSKSSMYMKTDRMTRPRRPKARSPVLFFVYLVALFGSLISGGACLVLPCVCYLRIFSCRGGINGHWGDGAGEVLLPHELILQPAYVDRRKTCMWTAQIPAADVDSTIFDGSMPDVVSPR